MTSAASPDGPAGPITTRSRATKAGARRERWTYEQLHVILSRAAIKPDLTDYWMMSDFSRPEFEQRLSELSPEPRRGSTGNRIPPPPRSCHRQPSRRRWRHQAMVGG
jgi:hypothetical protein